MSDILSRLRAHEDDPDCCYHAGDIIGLAANELLEETRRLREDLSRINEGFAEAAAKCVIYEQHIKELRERLAIRRKEIDEGVAPPRWHYITDDQIDAAWATRVEDGDFISASKLGIERCEGCGGGGQMWAPWDDSVLCNCSECNSKGWTKTNA